MLGKCESCFVSIQMGYFEITKRKAGRTRGFTVRELEKRTETFLYRWSSGRLSGQVKGYNLTDRWDGSRQSHPSTLPHPCLRPGPNVYPHDLTNTALYQNRGSSETTKHPGMRDWAGNNSFILFMGNNLKEMLFTVISRVNLPASAGQVFQRGLSPISISWHDRELGSLARLPIRISDIWQSSFSDFIVICRMSVWRRTG
jgi:hypothetical protein